MFNDAQFARIVRSRPRAPWQVLYDDPPAGMSAYRPGALWVVVCGWCSIVPHVLWWLIIDLVLYGSCSMGGAQ